MKNIVLCVSLNDQSLDMMKSLKGSPLLKGDVKIHLVHCFEIQIYTSDLSPFIFPTEEKYPEIEEATLNVLNDLESQIVPQNSKAKVVKKCFFSQAPKQKIKEYLDEVDADLAVIATRGKHGIEGLFSSSFAEHLVRYSPCDLHILRPKK